MKPCEAFRFGKPKQNNVIKESDHNPAKINSEQIFIDLSSAKGGKDGLPVQSKQH